MSVHIAGQEGDRITAEERVDLQALHARCARLADTLADLTRRLDELRHQVSTHLNR